MNPKIFPAILIVLDVVASIAYVYSNDWRRAVYWISAAILTASVTF